MSDTPRSDEVFSSLYTEAGQALGAMYDRSCELERELAARKREITRLKYLLYEYKGVSDELEDAIKLLLKELDETKSELAAAKRDLAGIENAWAEWSGGHISDRTFAADVCQIILRYRGPYLIEPK